MTNKLNWMWTFFEPGPTWKAVCVGKCNQQSKWDCYTYVVKRMSSVIKWPFCILYTLPLVNASARPKLLTCLCQVGRRALLWGSHNPGLRCQLGCTDFTLIFTLFKQESHFGHTFQDRCGEGKDCIGFMLHLHFDHLANVFCLNSSGEWDFHLRNNWFRFRTVLFSWSW